MDEAELAVAAARRPPHGATAALRGDCQGSNLMIFLLDPHPKMPDLGLSRSAAADLAAYIASPEVIANRQPSTEAG